MRTAPTCGCAAHTSSTSSGWRLRARCRRRTRRVRPSAPRSSACARRSAAAQRRRAGRDRACVQRGGKTGLGKPKRLGFHALASAGTFPPPSYPLPKKRSPAPKTEHPAMCCDSTCDGPHGGWLMHFLVIHPARRRHGSRARADRCLCLKKRAKRSGAPVGRGGAFHSGLHKAARSARSASARWSAAAARSHCGLQRAAQSCPAARLRAGVVHVTTWCVLGVAHCSTKWS
mmetsp:Transcript_13476/g.39056  ORF Transcript_13476/g.39056 Transcript_13476/m.39056 type:complete len:230 (+) Transcript_13476:977-1666(+)